MNKSYDLAIIGSGPGGYVAGLYASRLGLKACVIEKDLIGGTCLNWGCVPTKVMLHSAALLSQARGAASYGVICGRPAVDFPIIARRRDEVVTRLRTGIETLFRARGVDLIKGTARLKSPATIDVAGEEISAGHIIIATGSRPARIPGADYDEDSVCTSDGILSIKELPKSIVIVGGGVIGCEFATLFNAFGCHVTIVEMLDKLLATQSREASKKLETLLKKRGIDIYTSSKVESVVKSRPVTVKISGGKEIVADKVLVSVGRTAQTGGLGLEELGIKTGKGKIVVDGHLRTNAKNIYAIGDCVPGPLLAHKASYDGILACDAIAGHPRKVDYSNIPNCIFTDPEIASVGMTEEEAKASHPDAKVAKFPYLGSGKAYLMGKTEGFLKIIGDSKGSILGIEIFGAEACGLIGEAVLAKTMGVNIKDLSYVVHGHPTLSEIFQEAAHIFCGTGIHTA
ncbi:MAG: dihydrolipoyl dehydrogenase [Candidatus Omnitrophica bacterium]|nr:dihydrolipoyl dehydrogenase [Candidatus Omnitrophota bacterium]